MTIGTSSLTWHASLEEKKKLSLSSEHDTACYSPDSAFENKV